MNRAIALLCVTLWAGLALNQNVYAFKIDTHIFIAQEVLNDVIDDGHVSISIGDSSRAYAVAPDIVAAVRANPAYFRMGSIGPDAFPGIISGQSVIHPGSDDPSSWGTGEWLYHLAGKARQNQEIAFASGFLVHAASDVFAHTYVNHYSGNVFDLKDETHVERRHFLLESFIASKNPPIVDNGGKKLGTAAGLLKDPEGNLAIPARFLANSLIFDSTSSREFATSAPHLTMIYKHEQNLAGLERSARDIVVQIEKLIIFYYTDIALKDKQVRELRGYLNDLRKLLFPGDQIRKLIDFIGTAETDLTNEQNRAIKKALDLASDIYSRHAKTQDDLDGVLADIAKDVDRFNSKIVGCNAVFNSALRACEGLLESRLVRRCKREVRKKLRPKYDACVAIERETSLWKNLERKRKLQRNLELEISGLKDEMKDVADDINDILIASIEFKTAALKLMVDWYERSLEDANGLVSWIVAWRKDVTVAMDEYVEANGTAVVNAIIPGEKVLDPLKRWLDCHSLPIIGLPSTINDGICSVGDTKETIVGKSKDILNKLAKIDPVSKLLLDLVESIEKDVKEIVKEVSIELLEEITGEPVKTLLEIMQEPATPDHLGWVFIQGEQHRLKAIPDVAYRVGAEMGLSHKQPYFDPNNYAVVYNAILLSKLSLLPAAEMDKLAKDAGLLSSETYGESLYSNDTYKDSNILFGAVRSIDGSHQWRETAMPRLQTDAHVHQERGRFSYLNERNSRNGFRLWIDKEARALLFRNMFKGPLVPGVDAPEIYGFTPILHKGYPYRVCSDNPWPNDNDPADPDVTVDTSCPEITVSRILDEYPDDTLENAEKLRNIHKLLSVKDVDSTVFEDADHWSCLSFDTSRDEFLRWTLRFSPSTKSGQGNGKFYASLFPGDQNQDDANEKLALKIVGTYEIIGSYLFTRPNGGGVLSTTELAVPTLHRRFTQHPQRFWIELVDAKSLVVTNQDGTSLLCNSVLQQ